MSDDGCIQNLKVIAFKLPESQVTQIKILCDEGFYPSLSEAVRIAITDYISFIIDYINQNDSEYWIPATENKLLSDISRIPTKISACTKMPIELLKTIDKLIEQNTQFNNRTNFIRLAVNRFLEKDFQIYSQWMPKSFKNSILSFNQAST